jgi:predicted transposase YbfD/YdcC
MQPSQTKNELIDREKKSLVECFELITDPRCEDDILHNLVDIIVIVILASLTGAKGFNEIYLFAQSREQWLRRFLELPNGIPSHDTINRVMSKINPKEFKKCFLLWVETLYEKVSRELIAVDGKTARRTKCVASGQKAIHVVSAWAKENQLVLGQIKVDEKSNEITAIPELLNLLDITGCIISLDAMGTQTDIAQTIVDKGAEYVLAVKENQKTLHDDIHLYFAQSVLPLSKKELTAKGMYFRTHEKDHGRIEERQYFMVDNVAWLSQKERWPKLQAIGLVRGYRTINDVTTCHTRIYIMSSIKDVKEFAYAVRGHWTVENSLHWTMDVGLREDESRARKDHSAENLNVVRHMVINMLKKEKTLKQGIAAKQYNCLLNNEYFEKVLSTVFDLSEWKE